MRAEVRHLAARIIPEPAEMIERSMRAVGPFGCGTEPHLVVEFARRGVAWRCAEARHDVAIRAHADGVDLAEIAAAHEFFGLLVMTAAALLRAHLDDAVVLARGLGHPLPFGDKQRHR